MKKVFLVMSFESECLLAFVNPEANLPGLVSEQDCFQFSV